MVPPAPPDARPAERRALAIGIAAALLCLTIPFTRVVFHPLATLIHELGHAVADWMLGRPAIPAFDFVHGGGLTVSQGRSRVLIIGIAAVWIGAAYALRFRPRAAVAVAALAFVWCVALASGVDEGVILVAGHAFELLFAGLFAYRAWTGRHVRGTADRAAYAFAATFVWAANLAFAWGLTFRHEARVEYELAKGGGAWMDLSRLAREHLDVPLATVATAYLALVVAVPPVVWFVRRSRTRIATALAWLFEMRAGTAVGPRNAAA